MMNARSEIPWRNKEMKTIAIEFITPSLINFFCRFSFLFHHAAIVTVWMKRPFSLNQTFNFFFSLSRVDSIEMKVYIIQPMI